METADAAHVEFQPQGGNLTTKVSAQSHPIPSHLLSEVK